MHAAIAHPDPKNLVVVFLNQVGGRAHAIHSPSHAVWPDRLGVAPIDIHWIRETLGTS